MANTTATLYTPANNIGSTFQDLGNGTFAQVVASVPGLNAKATKVKGAKHTLGTAGTVTVFTLPANVYAFSIRPVTALATVGFATGADTVTVTATSGTAVLAAALGVGGLVYVGDTVTALNPEGNTTLNLVADVNSTVVNLVLYITG